MALTDHATSYFTINAFITNLLEIHLNILLKCCKNIAACWLQDLMICSYPTGDFLQTLQDPDLNVRRVALALFNSAAHNKPSLIRDLLNTVLPSLYNETKVRRELIREVTGLSCVPHSQRPVKLRWNCCCLLFGDSCPVCLGSGGDGAIQAHSG